MVAKSKPMMSLVPIGLQHRVRVHVAQRHSEHKACFQTESAWRKTVAEQHRVLKCGMRIQTRTPSWRNPLRKRQTSHFLLEIPFCDLFAVGEFVLVLFVLCLCLCRGHSSSSGEEDKKSKSQEAEIKQLRAQVEWLRRQRGRPNKMDRVIRSEGKVVLRRTGAWKWRMRSRAERSWTCRGKDNRGSCERSKDSPMCRQKFKAASKRICDSSYRKLRAEEK